MRHDVTRPPDAGIEKAIGRIGSSRKYRSIASETIEDVVRRELERRGGRSAAALSAARETLHRVAAFYLGEPEYARVGAELEAARLDAASLEAVCLGILSAHVSTRERLPIMADFFRAIFERTGKPTALADLASACTPFSFRWMGLDRSVVYRAYDINADLVELVSRYFRAEGIPGEAVLRDVLCSPPEEPADVALLLKMYHCLEHRRRGAGLEVVSRVKARWVAVSFPSRNMQGRVADIAGNYRGEILERASAAGWRSEDLELDGESVLLVHKEGS
jgi:16S rRNA (guanine(1405)-N(7))-methyltransferase